MEQLPYELRFCHKFNLHKWLGLNMDDYDLRTIARIYGVKLRALKKIEDSFEKNLLDLAETLRRGKGKKPPLDTPVRICAIGDSITSDRESYAKILARAWKDDPKRTIIDCSVSGDTTCHLIERFYSTIVSEEFDWAVLFIGTNDCRELDDEAHISNISLDEYKRNMRFLMKSLLDRGKIVVNVTIPYVDNLRLRQMFTESNQRYDDERVDRTNDSIRELSREHRTHLADLAEACRNYGDDVLEEDGIHMNSHGHMLLCGLIWDILP